MIVDRLAVKETARRRLTDSVETALGLSAGVVVLDFVDLPGNDPHRERMYSEHLACLYDDLSFDELEPRSFSFSSPWGACPDCTGLGTKLEVDPELIVPDESKSLADGAIAPWSGGGTGEVFLRLIESLGRKLGFGTDAPWSELPAAARHALLHGSGEQVHVRYTNRHGRQRSYYTNFEGVIPWVERRHAEAESDSSREKFAGYMREVPCPSCHGARLKPASLAVTVDGRSIAEYCALPIGELAKRLLELDLSDTDRQIAARILAEVGTRLGFLLDVGLDYLTLDRASATLAGGEAQRIRLATQIGSGLTGVLYVLDEPSAGLHQRDNQRLLETLRRLRDLGNTVIVVEHDEETIRAADWIVDIGPRAGEHGGQIVVSGPLPELLASTESLTGAYLSGRRVIPRPAQRRTPTPGLEVTVEGAAEHNLRGVDVAFPLGCLVAVTGVSGSGKSTLVNDILYKALARELNGARTVPGRHARITGIQHLDKVVHVDQGPIGRTPRSNPATYTGVFDHVRKLFAQTAEAKVRGYQPGRFSFNVKGGRCEACSGDGTLKIEMQFLPDVYVPCEVCHGARYNTDTLAVHYKGKTIAEVLGMPIEEAAEFFAPVPAIHRHLKTLVDVGLGYVRLGQPAPTLSGGEAQRVKLAAELQRRATGRTIYVLDEPTTGLHFEDIRKVLAVLRRLVGRRQHGHRDRAQPGRDQDRGLGHRPGPRGRAPGRVGDRLRPARAGRRRAGEPYRPVPARRPGRLPARRCGVGGTLSTKERYRWHTDTLRGAAASDGGEAADQEQGGAEAEGHGGDGGAGDDRVDLAGALTELLHRPVDVPPGAHPFGYGVDRARQLRAGAVDVCDQRVLIGGLRFDFRVSHLRAPFPGRAVNLAWRSYHCPFGIEGFILSGPPLPLHHLGSW